jgi:hypothetical protein
MAGIVACASQMLERKELYSLEKTYTIYGPGNHEDTLENYTLIPVEKTGFVVIKNVITLDDWD